jgi:DNA-directed RNA polymerase specialized sigma24 family protein
MSASPDEVLGLYDAHAPRLFALALRITGSRDAAAAVLEEVFLSSPLPSDLDGLVRLTRRIALAQHDRTPDRPVDHQTGKPSPRVLIEEVFYRGRTADELAAAYSLPVATVREMLRDGMAGLRRELGGNDK